MAGTLVFGSPTDTHDVFGDTNQIVDVRSDEPDATRLGFSVYSVMRTSVSSPSSEQTKACSTVWSQGSSRVDKNTSRPSNSRNTAN